MLHVFVVLIENIFFFCGATSSVVFLHKGLISSWHCCVTLMSQGAVIHSQLQGTPLNTRTYNKKTIASTSHRHWRLCAIHTHRRVTWMDKHLNCYVRLSFYFRVQQCVSGHWAVSQRVTPLIVHSKVCLQSLGSTTAYVKKVVKSLLLLQRKLHVVWWIASSDVIQWLSCG